MQEKSEKSSEKVPKWWNPSVKEAGKYMYRKDVYLESKGTITKIVNGEPRAVVKKHYIKKVIDVGNYVKIFVSEDDVLPFGELSSGALRMVEVIFKLLEVDNDEVHFDFGLMEEYGFSESQYYKALKELLDNKWLYKKKPGYYINILRFFKGDREVLVNKYREMGILV